MRIPESVLRSVDKVIMIGCGTASYAGQVARYAIEHWCRIPCEVELSSETHTGRTRVKVTQRIEPRPSTCQPLRLLGSGAAHGL